MKVQPVMFDDDQAAATMDYCAVDLFGSGKFDEAALTDQKYALQSPGPTAYTQANSTSKHEQSPTLNLPDSENLIPSLENFTAPIFEKRSLFIGLDEDEVLIPQAKQRTIAKNPYKVLDAPALQDDYYLNLVDWSS